MKVEIKKDSEGFIATVEGHDNIFAHGETEVKAKKELVGVLEMMMDYHLEQVEKERNIKNAILSSEKIDYAV